MSSVRSDSITLIRLWEPRREAPPTRSSNPFIWQGTEMSARRHEVAQLSPERIQRNPENPRLFFRGEELDSLLASISRYGVQVPITVYKEGSQYFLIDGER